MDLTETIAPKSDQINAEDLLTGPRTFTIDHVAAGSAEQPVDVHLVEFPGRPYRPSKSMRRVMVAAWGKEASEYTGHRLTLYRDAEVTFGRDKVGGIKISHLSHIDKRLSLALTVTRGKRAMHTVDPLPNTPAAPTPLQRLGAAFKAAGMDKDAARKFVADVMGRPVADARELTDTECNKVTTALETGEIHKPADEPEQAVER